MKQYYSATIIIPEQPLYKLFRGRILCSSEAATIGVGISCQRAIMAQFRIFSPYGSVDLGSRFVLPGATNENLFEHLIDLGEKYTMGGVICVEFGLQIISPDGAEAPAYCTLMVETPEKNQNRVEIIFDISDGDTWSIEKELSGRAAMATAQAAADAEAIKAKEPERRIIFTTTTEDLSA